MKHFYFLFFCIIFLYADDTNTTVDFQENSVSGLIEVKDNSGATQEQLQEKANQIDNSIENISKEKTWEDLSPKAQNYDWVQTTSKEWFRGEIIALYDGELQFDSKEIGGYTFDIEDVAQIKSHNIISVNVENIASFSGLLRYKDKKVKVIQGENEYEFNIEDVVSFAPDGEQEIDYWSGKITISLDLKSGNVNQLDYTAKGEVYRRTSSSILSFDYLARLSSLEGTETTNNQRLNQKYDRYITRYFFWTPLVSEYYTDRFKNINKQITAGMGAGYTFYKTPSSDLRCTVAPSVIYTKYQSVADNEDIEHYSPALELNVDFDSQINKISDLTFNYQLTFGDTEIGKLKHHMVTTLENELLSWLDLDVSLVWDYIHKPQERSDGTFPKRNDYQLLVGLGIEF
ncbi:DUF481 domain-containing protein [Sulfurimonas sp.]|uniref:DUF481 domain-containing protein n=1 Tax=Sulfurimonas sp. TaxID=2022749 RepID=UPI003D097F36